MTPRERTCPGLQTSTLLQADTPPRNWRECRMEAAPDEAQGADAADAGAVAFQLPAEPRPATVDVLQGAAQELQRAGGPFAPPSARHALARALQVPRCCLPCTLFD